MNWLSLETKRDETKGFNVKSPYFHNRLCWRIMASWPPTSWYASRCWLSHMLYEVGGGKQLYAGTSDVLLEDLGLQVEEIRLDVPGLVRLGQPESAEVVLDKAFGWPETEVDDVTIPQFQVDNGRVVKGPFDHFLVGVDVQIALEVNGAARGVEVGVEADVVVVVEVLCHQVW